MGFTWSVAQLIIVTPLYLPCLNQLLHDLKMVEFGSIMNRGKPIRIIFIQIQEIFLIYNESSNHVNFSSTAAF